jgi:hypothetical protein
MVTADDAGGTGLDNGREEEDDDNDDDDEEGKDKEW